MHQTQTLAIKITAQTWPIATACLAGGFASYALEEVRGCYLVINEVTGHEYAEMGERPVVALGNSWWRPDDFEEGWQRITKEAENGFVQVKRRPPPKDDAVAGQVVSSSRYRYDQPLRRARRRGNR